MRPSSTSAPNTTDVALAAIERRDRDSARTNDDALVAYERKWNLKLRKLQCAHPHRWRVAGLSEEEVRDALTLALMEAVRTQPGEWAKHERPGKEWGLSFAQQHLRALRKRFGLRATPTDFTLVGIGQHAPNQEDRWLTLEADHSRALAQQRAEQNLSRPQRQWLAALKMSANAGAFFQTSDLPNLSAAARVLGKDRSSAQRAYRDLQSHFLKELIRLR